jgi:hypothetical protein
MHINIEIIDIDIENINLLFPGKTCLGNPVESLFSIIQRSYNTGPYDYVTFVDIYSAAYYAVYD